MARGKAAEIGATRVAANGYHYTKVDPEEHPESENGWILTHWLTAEKMLGRHVDNETEQVRFVEPKFKRQPYDPEGIQIIKKKKSSLRHQLSLVEARIVELEGRREELKRLIGDESAAKL